MGGEYFPLDYLIIIMLLIKLTAILVMVLPIAIRACSSLSKPTDPFYCMEVQGYIDLYINDFKDKEYGKWLTDIRNQRWAGILLVFKKL